MTYLPTLTLVLVAILAASVGFCFACLLAASARDERDRERAERAARRRHPAGSELDSELDELARELLRERLGAVELGSNVREIRPSL